MTGVAPHREIARVCPLVPPDAALQGHCAWCGRALVGRHTTWCSRRHALAWNDEHVWSFARRRALRGAAPDRKPIDALCARCGAPEETWRTCWQPSAGRYVRCVGESCGAEHLPRRRALQVDHIRPRAGRGYGTGCWNHASNLQVLCGTCHAVAGVVRRTIAEALVRASARALPEGALPEPLSLWDRAMLVTGRSPQAAMVR